MAESLGYVTLDVIPSLRGGISGLSRELGAGAAVAGKTSGAEFGTKFATEATITGRKATAGIFANAEKGAAVAGLGMGRRFGTALHESLLTYGKTIGATVVGFFAYEKVKELVTGIFEEGEKTQQTMALLEAHLKSTGGAAGVTAQQIEELAAQQEHLIGVDKDTIAQAENLELTFTNIRGPVFEETLKAAEDLAAGMGIDLTNAMRLVGRAVNDPIHGLTSLTRYGVQFTTEQQDQIKTLEASGQALQAQGIVLDQLGKKFAGSAQAADTPTKQLVADFHTWEQEMGTKLIPLLNEGSAALVGLGHGAGDVAHLIGEIPAPIRDAALAMLAFKAASSGFTALSRRGGVFDGIGARALYMGDAVKEANAKMLAARGGAVALGTGLLILGSHISSSDQDLKALTNTAAYAAIGFSVTGGPWGAAIGGAIGLLSSLSGGSQEAAQKQAALATAAQTVADTLNSETGAITRSTVAQLEKNLADGGAYTAANQLGIAYSTVTQAALGQGGALQSILAQRKQDIALALQAGQAQIKAAASSGQLNGAAVEQGKIIDAVNAKYAPLLDAVNKYSTGIDSSRHHIEQTTRAQDLLNLSQHKFVPSAAQTVHVLGQLGIETGRYGDAASGIASQVGPAVETTKQLAKAAQSAYDDILKLDNLALGKRGAFLNYQQGLLDLTAALKQNGDAIDKHTAKGIADNQSLNTAVQGILDYASKLKDGSKAQVDYLNKAHDALVQRMIPAFDGSRKAAEAYVDQILKVPHETTTQLLIDRKQAQHDLDIQNAALAELAAETPTTTVKVDTAQAQRDMAAFKGFARQQLDEIPDEPVNIVLSAQSSKVLNQLGITGSARGEYITGGMPGRDSVVRALMPGEFVLQKQAVDLLGLANVKAMNDLKLPGMAAGGPVLDLYAHSTGMSGAVGSVERIFAAIAQQAGSALSKQVSSQLARVPSGGSTALTAGGAWDAIAQAARLYNWGSGPEWDALVKVINRESGGNPLAQNPTSSAFGIGQFLDGTWASVGGYKTTDPYLQSIFMDRYIKQRYGDPIGAWAHEVSAGWYDDHGGPLAPKSATLVLNGTNDQHQVVHGEDIRVLIAAVKEQTRVLRGQVVRDLARLMGLAADNSVSQNASWDLTLAGVDT